MDLDYNEKNWANPCPKYDCRKAACKCGLEYVNIPTSLGDDSEGSKVAPHNGAYCNALVIYEANGHVYIYTKEGVPTLIDVDASDISTLEQEVIKAQKDVHELREDIDDFIYGYDTVASMKSASNLDNGDTVKTLGYYAKNDGGGAYYRVVNSVPSGPYETLGNLLYAELIVEDTMNVRQFGAKGDGMTDDTNSINKAIANSKRIIVNEGVYKISRFLPAENQEFIGVGDAKILTNGLAPQVVFNNYNTVANIKFESASESLEWNRASIDHKNDIKLENCAFIGFRHQSSAPNAWGIILGHAKMITIKKCYFDNNSQSDLAIVNGCENIQIDQCSGSAFFINIEPTSADYANKNISINNCNLSRINILENSYTGTANQSVLISNCSIGLLKYDGGSTTIIDCNIEDIYNELTNNIIYGGELRLISSGNFSKNLIDDPYIDTYEHSTTSTRPWHIRYTPTSLQNAVSSINDENGIQFILNPNNSSTVVDIAHQPLPIDPNKKYLLRVNGKCSYPSGSKYVSINFGTQWLDSNGDQIRHEKISMFRGKVGTTTPFSQQTAVLVPPENAVSLRLHIYSAASPTASGIISVRSIFVRSVELFEFSRSIEPNSIIDLPVRTNRVFKNPVTPTSQYGKYYAGDMLYFDNPTTYIGQIATADGYGNAAGWTNFGALES